MCVWLLLRNIVSTSSSTACYPKAQNYCIDQSSLFCGARSRPGLGDGPIQNCIQPISRVGVLPFSAVIGCQDRWHPNSQHNVTCVSYFQLYRRTEVKHPPSKCAAWCASQILPFACLALKGTMSSTVTPDLRRHIHGFNLCKGALLWGQLT